MNTDTGQIRVLEELSEAERASGEWVPVSDAVAQAAIEAQLEAKVAAIRKLEAEQK